MASWENFLFANNNNTYLNGFYILKLCFDDVSDPLVYFNGKGFGLLKLITAYERLIANQKTIRTRVAAKKIVSWLRFSLSRSPFFVRDLDQNFHLQSFAMPWMRGYQASHLQDGRRSTQKENKTRFYFNSFTHYSGTDTQGSQEFIPKLWCY